MIWAIASLLGVGGIGAALWFVPGLAVAALAFVRGLSPTTVIIAVLAASSVFLWFNASSWKAQAEKCATRRAADHKAYSDAQASATMIALAAKRETEAKQETARKEADANLQTAMGDANSRLARYIRLHTATTKGATSGPDLSKPADTAQVADGPSAATILVSADDLAVCTENTTRLVNAHDEAERLNRTPAP